MRPLNSIVLRWGIVFVVAASLTALFAIQSPSPMSFSETVAKNLANAVAGRRAVVVGGTAGIGKGIALRLSQAAIDVTIVGRNKAAGAEIVAAMQVRRLT